MKRFLTTILLLATITGVFAPVTASLVNDKIEVHTQFAQATTDPATSSTTDPTTNTTTPASTNPATTTSADTQIEKHSNTCGVTHFFSGGTLGGCIVQIVYWLSYQLGGFLMHLSAWMFDALAAVSLSSTAYTASTFITDGWRITRDFSNVFFILILLYAALAMMLDLEFGHANPKKMVASVIIIAIVINFSMFITGIIIDTSNTLALVFYNQINVTSNVTTGSVAAGQVKPTSISEALVQAFQPQQLQTAEFWDNLVEAPTRHTVGDGLKGAALGAIIPGIGPVIGFSVGALVGYFVHTTTTVSDSTMIAILLLVGIMYMVVAYSFFIASISFIGRMVGLWVAIIFAPFAFVSYIIPATQHIKGIGWTDWWKDLVSTAFAAPIYFFFLYLIALMMKSSMVSANFMKTNGSSTGLVIIIISFLFLITLLLKATSYVKEAAGEIGNMVFKGLQVAGGWGSALALGGIAFGARRVIGKNASDFINSDKNKDLAAGRVTTNSLQALKDKFGHQLFNEKGELMNVDDMSHDQIKNTHEFQRLQRESEAKFKRQQKLANNSFDFRQTTAGGIFAKATGMDMSGFGAFSTARSAGGWEGEKARKAEKLQKFAKSLEASHDQQEAFDDVISKREDELELEEATLKLQQAERDSANKEYTDAKDEIINAEKRLKELLDSQNPNDIITAAQLKESLSAGGRLFIKGDITEIAAAEARLNAIQNSRDPAYQAEASQIRKDLAGPGTLYKSRELIKEKSQEKTITVQNQQQKVNDLRGGTKDPSKSFYTQADLGRVPPVTKADGTEVTQHDVNNKVRTTEARGIAELKAMKARNEKDHMKSYAHMKMLQSGYQVHGTKLDEYGQIKKMGHMDFNATPTQAMR